MDEMQMIVCVLGNFWVGMIVIGMVKKVFESCVEGVYIVVGTSMRCHAMRCDRWQ